MAAAPPLLLLLSLACAEDLRPPALAGLTVDASAPRPNVLVLLIDDMGYSDLAAFGSPNVSTPHVDALARGGARFTQWISAASICTPSRAALQTGRYPIRTGCTGSVEARRVVPTPSNPGGLDPAQHLSIATALKQGGYATGMSGKWHLGISSNGLFEDQDFRFHPNSHGYDTYLGSPFTNAPMCEMDSDGISQKISTGPSFCFMLANKTVVQQPLRGGEFGDNVEEMDDSVGEIMAALKRDNFDQNTLIFLTSDNGPYQEEGWEKVGRANIYDDKTGELIGRLKGGKGQLYEGGIRVPGIVKWPGVVVPGTVSDTMVSTMDIFPTALAAAGVKLGDDYVVDGRDMGPVLRGTTMSTQHDVFLHYCGFGIVAARVAGRFKVFWATPKWYTNDKADPTVCQQCCNGINAASRLTGTTVTLMCGCEQKDMDFHDPPIVYDMLSDRLELEPLTAGSWPSNAGVAFAEVVRRAGDARRDMEATVHPKPDNSGAGTCTAGLPSSSRQPCCPGCHATLRLTFPSCVRGFLGSCSCDDVHRFGNGSQGFGAPYLDLDMSVAV